MLKCGTDTMEGGGYVSNPQFFNKKKNIYAGCYAL
jgi:hypothetical protein